MLWQLFFLQLLEKLRRNKQSLLGLQLQLQAPTTVGQQLIKLKRLALQLRLQAQWQVVKKVALPSSRCQLQQLQRLQDST